MSGKGKTRSRPTNNGTNPTKLPFTHCTVRNIDTGRSDRLPAVGGSMRYFLHSELFNGVYGRILLCHDSETEQQVCIKEQRVRERTGVNRPYHEATIMRYCQERATTSRHDGRRHIVEYIDSFVDSDLNMHYIVMPYYNLGDALTFVDDLDKNTYGYNKVVRNFARDIYVALDFLHAIGVFHRDIKLENFVVFYDTQARRTALKLIDFGFASIGEPDEARCKAMGSPLYCAPELLMPNTYGKFFRLAGPDLWAATTCVYCLVTNRYPFLMTDDVVTDGHEVIISLIRCMQRRLSKCPKATPCTHPACCERCGPVETTTFYNPACEDDIHEWSKFFRWILVAPIDRPSVSDVMCDPIIVNLLIEDSQARVFSLTDHDDTPRFAGTPVVHESTSVKGLSVSPTQRTSTPLSSSPIHGSAAASSSSTTKDAKTIQADRRTYKCETARERAAPSPDSITIDDDTAKTQPEYMARRRKTSRRSPRPVVPPFPTPEEFDDVPHLVHVKDPKDPVPVPNKKSTKLSFRRLSVSLQRRMSQQR